MLSKSIKKIIPYRHLPSSNRRNFEDSEKVLAVSVSEITRVALPTHACRMVITAACVQMDVCVILDLQLYG